MPPKHSPGPAVSLGRLIDQLINARADQMCLVRPSVGLSPAAILVLLVGDPAIKKIGGCFLTFAKTRALGDPAKLVDLNFHQPQHDLFNFLERLNRGGEQRWAYGTFAVAQKPKPVPVDPRRPKNPGERARRVDAHATRCAVLGLSGNDLCRQMAVELTTRGLRCEV